MYWRDSNEKENIRLDNRRRVPAADNSAVFPCACSSHRRRRDNLLNRHSSDDHIDLKGKRLEDINELFAEVTAKRCFAPANITEDESTIMVDITTNDGAKHIIFNDEAYLYSSADDIIWYRLENALYLRLFVEYLPHVEE